MKKTLASILFCLLGPSLYADVTTGELSTTLVQVSAGNTYDDVSVAGDNIYAVAVLTGATLINSDLSDKTITYTGSSTPFQVGIAATVGTETVVSNVDFSGLTLNSASNTAMVFGQYQSGANCDLVYLENVDFSNSSISSASSSSSYVAIFYETTMTNVSFDKATLSCGATTGTGAALWFSSANVTSCSFTNMTINMSDTLSYQEAITLSGNANQYTTLMDVSFVGTIINVGTVSALMDESDFTRSWKGSTSALYNIALGDGKLYSTGVMTWGYDSATDFVYYKDADGNRLADDYEPTNLGIVLQSEGDILTIAADVYLDVSSTLNDGDLVFNGGTLDLRDDAVLSIFGDELAITINIDAYDVGDDGMIYLSELITLDEDVQIAVMDGDETLTGDAALASMNSLISVVDANGESVSFTLGEDGGIMLGTIPEPSTVSLSMLALVALCARRRRVV